MNLKEQMAELGRQGKAASRELAKMTTARKNACLQTMADALEREKSRIQEANAQDLKTASEMGLSSAMIDRLTLSEQRIASMAQGLREVAELPDPVGRILEERERPNGLKLKKVAVPLGVIVIIYESRPNVTADAAGLCFKSGNATILRGGKEALNSNRTIAEIMVRAAREVETNFPEHAIRVVPTTDRAAIPELLSLTEYVDLCIPRGGEGLIRAVVECSKVPVIKHYKGVCHVYVDGAADLRMAEAITVNAKVQRPGVCNAAETLLVDLAIAPRFLPKVAKALLEQNVELRMDEKALKLVPHLDGNIKPAAEADWSAEYLDYILAVRVVNGIDEAIQHINRYGSTHSDAIVTGNEEHARRFLNEIDSSAVFWNASTRFNDGDQFGMGAEIGISTDKVGARGPMGLNELTTYKWLVYGTGQIRS